MVSRVGINVGVLLVFFASGAAAQTQAEPAYAQSIGIGAQWSFAPGGRTLSETPGVKMSWRRWYGPHLGTEVHLGRWRGENTSSFDSPQFRTRNKEAVTAYSIAFAMVGRIPVGRATVIVGAGPGWFRDRRDSEWETSSGTSEHHFAGGETHRSVGVHIVTEVDVRATRRMSVFGGFVSQVRDVRHTESNISYPNAGLRFAF